MDEETDAGRPLCDDSSNSDDRKLLKGTSLDNKLDGSSSSSEPPPPYLVALKEIEEEKKLRDQSRGSKYRSELIDAVQNPDKVINEEHSRETVMERLLEDHTVIKQKVVNIESRVDTITKTLENANELDQERWKEVKTDINNLQDMMQGIQHVLVKGSGVMQAQAVTYDEMEGWQKPNSLLQRNSDRPKIPQKHSDDDFSKHRASSKEWNYATELAGAAGGPPEDPEGGDSSDGERGDDRKGGGRKRRGREKNKCPINWIIDAEAWNICLKKQGEEDFHNESRTLLEACKIPNGDLLEKICANFGKKSETVLAICNAICEYLKQKFENIVEVWAGYWFEHDKLDDASTKNKIVFAVLTNDLQKIEDDIFTTCCRHYQETGAPDENLEILKSQREDPPSISQLEEIRRVQQECAPVLLKKHKRLTRIAVSWVKHTAGKAKQEAISKCICIALYVHIRGLIPLDEEPFERLIKGYPVDVREGVVILCKGPNDYHRHLKMGLAISGAYTDNQGQFYKGTLGAFVKFENHNSLFALTSAHILFPGPHLKHVFENGVGQNIYPVYQPTSSESPNGAPFGRVVLVKHKKGRNGCAGMEIALIEVVDRYPKSGKFPEAPNYSYAGFGQGKPFVFSSGKVVTPSALNTSAMIFKYGSQTKLTRGECQIVGSSIRTRTTSTTVNDFEIVLHEQIEVMPTQDVPFAEPGDSGALITLETNGELAAVGIFEGKMNDGSCYFFTPLIDILEELGSEIGARCFIHQYPHLQIPTQYQQNNPRIVRYENELEDKFREIDRRFEEIRQDFTSQIRDVTSELALQRDEQKHDSNEIKTGVSSLRELLLQLVQKSSSNNSTG